MPMVMAKAEETTQPNHHQQHQQHKKPHYYYIYEEGDWHNISTASTKHREDKHEIFNHTINHGAGPIISLQRGAYHTDQYQLFLLYYFRALRDHRRTLDPAQATTFFIPYDLASDVAYYKHCAKSEGTCFDFRRCPLAPKVRGLLEQSPWFQRRHGLDHVLIVGMNYAMEHYLMKPNCREFLSGICYNCTKFAIDDYSFLHSGDEGRVSKGDFWHAVPFPSDFHWTRLVKRPFPWEHTSRNILVSYVGTSRSYYSPARRLRQSLVHYCELHADLCVSQSYGLNGTRSSFLVEGYDPLRISQNSVFCFQPIGDLMTRKGLFDSMLQGCVPVVFDDLTAAVMYTWHWDESFWREVLVTLPFHATAHRLEDPVLLLQRLLVEQPEVVARKQALLRSRVFELQYSLEGPRAGEQQPLEQLVQLGFPTEDSAPALFAAKVAATTTSTTSTTWPMKSEGEGGEEELLMRDAFDIAMDLALLLHAGEVADVRNATVPECWNGRLDKHANGGHGKCIPLPKQRR